MIERLSEAMGAALVCSNFSPIPALFHRNFHFPWKKPFWFLTVELSRYCKSGSKFSSSEPVAARSNYRRLGNALCLISPVQPAQAVPERGPKSSASDGHWSSSQNLRLSSGIAFGSDFQMTGRGSNLDSTWTLPPDQRVVKVLSAPKSQNKLCRVLIHFRSPKKAEIVDITETISTLIHRTVMHANTCWYVFECIVIQTKTFPLYCGYVLWYLVCICAVNCTYYKSIHA